MMRAPVIPNGWPSAIAPPCGFSFSSGMSHSLMIGITCAANASFSSTTSTSSIFIPARSRTFLIAPIGAIPKALERAGMTIDDVDIVELNEAFAAQVIPIMAECNIPLEKMNPHGGAIALGHPFGMTGVRIMTTLLNGLETDDKTIGLETMCVAGGQGEAMIVERLN